MTKTDLQKQIESYLNSMSNDYRCIVTDYAYVHMLHSFDDYISDFQMQLSEELLRHLYEVRDLLNADYLSIDYADVVDTFVVDVYDVRRCNNGR